MKTHGFYMGKGSISFLTWMPLKKSWYQCSGHRQHLANSLETGWPVLWFRPTASLSCIPATSLPPLMTRIRFTVISWQESEKNVIKHEFKDTTFLPGHLQITLVTSSWWHMSTLDTYSTPRSTPMSENHHFLTAHLYKIIWVVLWQGKPWQIPTYLWSLNMYGVKHKFYLKCKK